MILWINVHIIYGGSRIFQTTGINTDWCILAIERPQGPRLAVELLDQLGAVVLRYFHIQNDIAVQRTRIAKANSNKNLQNHQSDCDAVKSEGGRKSVRLGIKMKYIDMLLSFLLKSRVAAPAALHTIWLLTDFLTDRLTD